MKLLPLLLLVAFLQVGARGLSQTKISLAEKNASLEKIFKEIRKQSGYDFLYINEQLKTAPKVDVTVDKASLDETLKAVLKNTGFTYSIEDKTIVIRPKPTVAPATNSMTPTETSLPPALIDVKGRVVNEKGEPIAGVSVLVKGTKRGTSTDENGVFELKGLDEAAVLQFSGVNIEAYEAGVKGRTELNFTAKAKVSILEDVAISVSTGYQNLNKERATGSFYKINNELVNRSVSSNVVDRISKITSGLQQYKGQLSIRGRSTIFANQNPLIVVDNFPFDGPIENINPNDIEDITILKDAAAASIWGALAGNGVIVITTKRAKLNVPLKVQVNSTLTIGEKPNIFKDPNFIDGSTFIDIERDLYSRGYYNSAINNTSTFPGYSPVISILAKQTAGRISAAEATSQIDALRNLDIRNDISKYYYQKSVAQQYALNITTGNAISSHYLGIGFDNSQPNLVANSSNRISISSQSIFKPSSRIEIGIGLSYVQSKNIIGNSLSEATSQIAGPGGKLYPYARFADNNGNPLGVTKVLSDSYTESMQAKGLLNWQYVPLNEIGLNQSKSKGADIRISTQVKYTILRGLDIDAKYQYLKSSSNSESFFDESSYYVRNLVNTYSIINIDGSIKRNFPTGAVLQVRNSELENHSGRLQLNFNEKLGKNQINALGGVEVRETKTDAKFNSYYGYNVNTASYRQMNFDSLYRTLPSGTAAVSNFAGITGTLNRYRSYYLNSSYTYDERYTLSVSGRIDQANLFGYKSNQKSTPLWSVGGKWNISKEKFYHINILSYLGLRLTYGYNGNLSKTATPLTLIKYAGSNNPYGAQYATIQNPGNPELSWEKIGVFNAAIDFQSRNNIISGSVEYYHKNGRNMIGDDIVDPTTGLTSITGNFSNMAGDGIDLTLNSKIIDRLVKWNTGLVLSITTNKITKYNGTNTSLGALIPGYPVGAYFALPWAGLDPNNGDPRGILADTISKIYTALNAIPIKDRKYIGSFTPTIFGNILNSFSIGRISLSANIIFRLKYYFTKPTIDYGTLLSNRSLNADYYRRWQQKGDELNTSVPSFIYPVNAARGAFYASSEILATQGDNVRLEDIRVAYDFNRLGKMFVGGQLFFYVNNIGTIWTANKNNIDPDFALSTNSLGYKTPKTFSLGIRANF